MPPKAWGAGGSFANAAGQRAYFTTAATSNAQGAAISHVTKAKRRMMGESDAVKAI